MPGCLGLDALWQMLGFFLGWLGAPGRGRALGAGEVKFSGMVVPTVKRLEYIVEVKRVIRRKFALGVGDGYLRGRRHANLFRKRPSGGLVCGRKYGHAHCGLSQSVPTHCLRNLCESWGSDMNCGVMT